MRSVFANEPEVLKQLNFYDATASIMTLHNIKAAAAFLSAYLQTDPHIDSIKEEYQNTLKFKEADDER